jgi:alpha-L-fucosidase
MWEKDLPGGNTAGFNAEAEVGTLPLETCDTISGAWGFNINDRKYKTTRELVHYLARAAGHNANFLLNVGPMADGKIQPEFVTRLREMGKWLAANGASIYGTRGGPVPPRDWGATTRRGDKIYVHVLDWPDATLLVPPLGARVRSARFLRDGSAAEFVQHELGVLLKLPPDKRDPLDTVVELSVL